MAVHIRAGTIAIRHDHLVLGAGRHLACNTEVAFERDPHSLRGRALDPPVAVDVERVRVGAVAKCLDAALGIHPSLSPAPTQC